MPRAMSGPPIDYRLITRRDQADIKALAAISVLDNAKPEALAESVDYFRDELTHLDPRTGFLVAAFAGMELVGFARFVWSERQRQWWCRGLVVVPEWQRRGIGSQLLRTGLAELAQRGVLDVWSDTGIDNKSSQAAHLKAGFMIVAAEGDDADGNYRTNRCFLRTNGPARPQ